LKNLLIPYLTVSNILELGSLGSYNCFTIALKVIFKKKMPSGNMFNDPIYSSRYEWKLEIGNSNEKNYVSVCTIQSRNIGEYAHDM
jgi:hypothetical protein